MSMEISRRRRPSLWKDAGLIEPATCTRHMYNILNIQLAKMSFDEIFDLTPVVHSSIFTIYPSANQSVYIATFGSCTIHYYYCSPDETFSKESFRYMRALGGENTI